ncbi:uncharacterized protein LOC128919844 [Zeugodacus cucurbitae]|uniref:uncharacterized protein LOC128919844 n=1 Tax=Zeugodacus cucurbitae TaxID=28588 RepID=UPI0023D9149D|nr:uncharacterized protein LOC128919844 [Zeugodacus cucurbitae]
MPSDDDTPRLPKASIFMGNKPAATIRVPNFNQDRPGLWFAQLESQFRNHNVTHEVDKFHHTIPLIDTRIAADAEDIILNPPADKPYQRLKAALIACYSKSREAKLLQLLDGEYLGDKTPSQHLRHLRSLVPDIDEEIIRVRWLSHLPDQMRTCLVTQHTAELQDLSEAADRLHEMWNNNSLTLQNVFRSFWTTNKLLGENAFAHNTATEEDQFLLLIQPTTRVGTTKRLATSLKNAHQVANKRETHQRDVSGGKRLSTTIVPPLHHGPPVSHTISSDTGSEVSVFPHKQQPNSKMATGYQLIAVNGTPVNTFGVATIVLNIGLRRTLTWRFILADVSSPIIGADLLSHYGLLVDLKNQRLIDEITRLCTSGTTRSVTVQSIKFQQPDQSSGYWQLLAEFPKITRPDGAPTQVTHTTQHHIKTTPGTPVSSRARRLAPDRLKIAKAEFQKMIKLGIARPSDSPWSSPLHLAPKKCGEWRPCGDYRRLNERTIPDRYPVRCLEDFTANLHGTSCYSTIDLIRAFNQIPVANEDVHKTAIITPFGLFEFPFMTFGLRNAAQTFQRFIDERRQHYGLVINTTKTKLGLKEVEFLGHTICPWYKTT